MANNSNWQRRTDQWVAAQHRSNKRKAEADRQDKHGDDRRRFMAEHANERQVDPGQ